MLEMYSVVSPVAPARAGPPGSAATAVTDQRVRNATLSRTRWVSGYWNIDFTVQALHISHQEIMDVLYKTLVSQGQSVVRGHMNSGAVEVKAIRRTFAREISVSAVSVMSLVLGLLPHQALAATVDLQWRAHIDAVCSNPTPPASWDLAAVGTMCVNAFPGGPAGTPTTAVVSANIGTVNAGSGVASRKKKEIRELLDEQPEKPEKGASAEGGGWGFLVTPHYGKSDRPNTDLESGYQSDLRGLVAGLDYLFSDRFVLGVAVGQSRDKANFVNDSGSLKTRNSTATMYGTWLASERAVVDGYLGYGRLSLDNQRRYAFGPIISGTMSSDISGRQVIAGISASYRAAVGQFNLTPSFGLDSIRTTFKDYRETGSDPLTDTMALRYGDRTVKSLTSSLGARLDASYGYDWGTLVPSARLAAVHEFQNKTRQINSELVITPGTEFLVTTDAPDRNYLLVGFGATAALNDGAQLFFDYERRNQDRLLNSWAISAGVLLGF